jgi:hypothetical protein
MAHIRSREQAAVDMHDEAAAAAAAAVQPPNITFANAWAVLEHVKSLGHIGAYIYTLKYTHIRALVFLLPAAKVAV